MVPTNTKTMRGTKTLPKSKYVMVKLTQHPTYIRDYIFVRTIGAKTMVHKYKGTEVLRVLLPMSRQGQLAQPSYPGQWLPDGSPLQSLHIYCNFVELK